MMNDNPDIDYDEEFEKLVTDEELDIKQIKPNNKKILIISLSIKDPYKNIEDLREKVKKYDNKDKKDKAIKIIKCLELLLEDPYDNFNIKNFVQEYQKVHNINDGEGHTPGKINRNETYTTDYYAMPYDGSEGVQHNKEHQEAYKKRDELIKNVKALKKAGKTLKKDVGKSKLKPEHKKEIYNIIDANNKLILEYDSTKTKDELSKLLDNENENLQELKTRELELDGSEKKSIQNIINDLYKNNDDNPFIDKNDKNTLITYDEKLETVKGKYTEYTGKKGAATNPQDESDYMYSVTYKSEDKGQKYADIFGIETIFRILRLTGSNIIPDKDDKEENEPKKKPYDVFNNYYKVDQKTKNPAYVSEYNKESTWNTNLLNEKYENNEGP